MQNIIGIFLSLILLLALGCESSIPTQDTTSTPVPKTIEDEMEVVTKHQLPVPTNEFKLSNKLREISGLSDAGNGQHLLAVNDEEGKIFYLNKSDGEIAKSVKFHKSGDYEGVELVGTDVYAVKSNGTIYRVTGIDTDEQETTNFKTFLNTAYDIEGLAYHAANNQLLLACKAKAGKGEEFKNKRAIYAFDLKADSLLAKPVLVLDRKQIRDSLQAQANFVNKLLEVFSPEQSAIAFAPSGIAVHPTDGSIYVLSSAGKILLRLHPNGSIHKVIALDKALFQQPEGICFDPQGVLYISSEGKNSRARLFRFDL